MLQVIKNLQVTILSIVYPLQNASDEGIVDTYCGDWTATIGYNTFIQPDTAIAANFAITKDGGLSMSSDSIIPKHALGEQYIEKRVFIGFRWN